MADIKPQNAANAGLAQHPQYFNAKGRAISLVFQDQINIVTELVIISDMCKLYDVKIKTLPFQYY